MHLVDFGGLLLVVACGGVVYCGGCGSSLRLCVGLLGCLCLLVGFGWFCVALLATMCLWLVAAVGCLRLRFCWCLVVVC